MGRDERMLRRRSNKKKERKKDGSCSTFVLDIQQQQLPSRWQYLRPAQEQYGPEVTDTEIKIGNTHALQRTGIGLRIIGKTIAAYFDKINAEDGINFRR
jgi:hypothetical protein